MITIPGIGIQLQVLDFLDVFGVHISVTKIDGLTANDETGQRYYCTTQNYGTYVHRSGKRELTYISVRSLFPDTQNAYRGTRIQIEKHTTHKS
jgi:hypothetical protein